MPISEQEKLRILLDHKGASLIGVTLAPEATDGEQVAKAIRKSILSISKSDPSAFRDIDLST